MTNSQLKRVIREEMTNVLGRKKSKVGNKRRLNEATQSEKDAFSVYIFDYFAKGSDGKKLAEEIADSIFDLVDEIDDDNIEGSEELIYTLVDSIDNFKDGLDKLLNSIKVDINNSIQSRDAGEWDARFNGRL